MTRQQYSPLLHWDGQDVGYTTGQCRLAAAHTTAIQHTTHRGQDGYHPLILSLFTITHQRTITINMINDQRSMNDQRTMNNEHDDDQ